MPSFTNALLKHGIEGGKIQSGFSDDDEYMAYEQCYI